MSDYILEISFDPGLEEIVQGQLFLTRSTGNIAVEPGRIEAYFPTAADRDAAAALFPAMPLRRLERPRVDWLQLYQQSLQPIFIGRSFVIAPDASLIPPDSGRHALVIPQEQAFGTGSHESTALCIELLEEIDLRGGRVLDIGSGSGILALAMLRLGARKAMALDNDLDAFAPLRENSTRNGLRIASFIGTLDALRGGTFDVITINIVLEGIVSMLPSVTEHLDGVLIVSGILAERRDEIARRMRVIQERTKGEWWAAILSK